MKSSLLRFLPLFGLVSAIYLASSTHSVAQTPAPLPAALVGSYQGLLIQPDSGDGLPFGRIEITSTAARKATGKLVLIDKKSYPFTINLTANIENTEASGTATLVNRSATATVAAQSLNLTLTLKSDGTFAASGNATLPPLLSGPYQQLAGAAFKTPTFVPVKAPCPWIGAYTATFTDATPTGSSTPSGAGYMTGAVSTAGVMTAAGKLADGTSFTSSMKPSSDGRHFLFLTPYTTTVGGYFASSFQLTQRSDNRWHVADGDAAWTKWKKPANSKDKVFAAGFGPLDVFLTMMQWVAPGTKQNVGNVMGLTLDEVFGLGLENLINPTTYAKWLPLKLGVNANNTLRVAQGGVGSPSPLLPTEWAKFYTGKVDPKTGVITVTLKIQDTITTMVPRPSSKTITRTVTFNGVMFQLLEGDNSPIANGFGFVPGLTTADPITYGGFGFTGPIEVDPLILSSARLAGNYTTVLDMLEPGTLPPSNIPAHGATIPLSISSDLKTLKFNGRTLPLLGDSRPVSLVFSDAQKTPMNNLTVTIYINNINGGISGIAAQYFQVVSFSPRVRVFTHRSGTIQKLP